MQHSNAHKVLLRRGIISDSGFTMIELIIVIVLVGILAAIGIPSILANLERNRMDYALTTIRGALEEAQKEATRKGKSCDLTINSSNRTVTSDPFDCLITGSRTIDRSITIATDPATSPTISFSFKGNTINGATIVLYATENPNAPNKRCLVITEGTGILRTGIYKDNAVDSIEESKCEASL